MRRSILLAFIWVTYGSVSCAFGIGGGLANSPWPDYGGGLRNTHLSPAIGPNGPVGVLWQYSIPVVPGRFNIPYRQPVLGSDGTIFFSTFTDGQGFITALNPNGSVKWSKNQGRTGFWMAVDANGYLYNEGWASTSSSNGTIFAQSQATGATIWQATYPGVPLESGPTVGNDGNVYTAVGGLSSFNLAGQLNWQVGASEKQYRNPAIAPDGTVYLDGQFQLKAFSPAGANIWTTNVGKRLGPVSINDSGNLFVGSANEITHAFYSFTSSGVERWRRNDLGGVAAIGPNGTIYAGYEGMLHAIHPDTGQDLWSYATGQIDEFGVEGVTVDALGNIYLANAQGILMSLSPAGALRWQFDLAPNDNSNVFPGAPVIGANGVIYVAGGSTNKVFAIGVPEPSTMLLAMVVIATLPVRHRKSVLHIRA